VQALIGKLGFERILNSSHERTAVKQDSKLNGAEAVHTDEQLVKKATKGGKSNKKLSRMDPESDSRASDLTQPNKSNGHSNSMLIAQFHSLRTRNHLLLKPGGKWFAHRVSC
jgi:hypothetical protein